MKEKILQYLQENYPEERIDQMIDDEIVSGDWVDDDWEEEDCEDEYDWYENFGHGEAEDAVKDEIVKEIENHFNISDDLYYQETEEHLWETLEEHSDKFTDPLDNMLNPNKE